MKDEKRGSRFHPSSFILHPSSFILPNWEVPVPLLSILTAFYNEEPNLPELRRRLELIAARIGPSYTCEFVLVDDHSADGSQVLAERWAAEDSRVRYLRLARNCGSHAAFAAGLAVARGDCAVFLAADLQDPPELIPQLLERWQAGFEVVWAVRSAREGISLANKVTSDLYYGLMRRWALPNLPRHGADFLLLDRKVILAMRAIPEKHTSLLGMVLWLGFRQTEIEYVKQARFAGKTKWTLRKKLKLLIDSLVSFSTVPLGLIGRLATGLTLATGVGLAALLLALAAGATVAGWVWVLLALFGLSAAQMTALAIQSAYLWRTFDQARGRPLYVIEKMLALAAETDSPGQAA
jgi:dolichol-phosphate mannosyltransferase